MLRQLYSRIVYVPSASKSVHRGGDNQPYIAALVTIDPDALKGGSLQTRKMAATIAELTKDR